MGYVYMNDVFFLYTLTDPRNGLVVYVGITRNPEEREHQHRTCSRNLPVGRWMDELAESGVEPVFTVLERIKGRDMAGRREREAIAAFRTISGSVLLNRVVGRVGRFNRLAGAK